MFTLWSLDEAHFFVSGRPLGQIMVSWPAHSFPVIDLLGHIEWGFNGCCHCCFQLSKNVVNFTWLDLTLLPVNDLLGKIVERFDAKNSPGF